MSMAKYAFGAVALTGAAFVFPLSGLALAGPPDKSSLELRAAGVETVSGYQCPERVAITGTVMAQGADRLEVDIRGPRFRPEPQMVSFAGSPSATVSESYEISWNPRRHTLNDGQGGRAGMRQSLDFRMVVRGPDGAKLETLHSSIDLACDHAR